MGVSRHSQNHTYVTSDPPTLESVVAIDFEIRGCRGGTKGRGLKDLAASLSTPSPSNHQKGLQTIKREVEFPIQLKRPHSPVR
jgi:hypothetical protein